MRPILVAATAALLAGPLAGPARAQQAPDSAKLLAEAGRAEYLQYCASCHGPTGKGDGALAEDLRKPPADLTQISKRHNGVFPEPLLVEIIDGRRRVRAHGSADMPVWGRRFGRERAGTSETAGDLALRARIMMLVEYLRSIQAK